MTPLLFLFVFFFFYQNSVFFEKCSNYNCKTEKMKANPLIKARKTFSLENKVPGIYFIFLQKYFINRIV